MTSFSTCKLYMLLAAVAFLVCIPGAKARFTPQAKGEIKGSVLNHKHLPFVKSIVLLFKDSIKLAQTLTDDNGDFYFSNLSDGSFHVEITHSKNKKAAVNNISVSANKSTVLLVDIHDTKKENKVDVFIYKTALKNPDPNFEYIDTAYKYELPQ